MPKASGRVTVRRRPNDGAAGLDAVEYRLVPSVTSVKVDSSGNLSAATVSVKVMKRVGQSAETDITDKLINTNKSNGLFVIWGTALGGGIGIETTVAKEMSYITFRLYQRVEGVDTVIYNTTIPILIDGAAGNWVSYVFKLSEKQPDTPTSEQTIPDGWSDAPTSSGRWWMSKATISGNTGFVIGAWSEPVQVTAEDGDNGSYVDYKYQKNTSATNYPTYDANSRNPGNAWKDTPPSLDSGEYLWMIQATIQDDELSGDGWSTPVRISGEKGASYTVNLLDGTNQGKENWLLWMSNTANPNGSKKNDDGSYTLGDKTIKPYAVEVVATQGSGIGISLRSGGSDLVGEDGFAVAFMYPVDKNIISKGSNYTLSFRAAQGGTSAKITCVIANSSQSNKLTDLQSTHQTTLYGRHNIVFTAAENGSGCEGQFYVIISFSSLTLGEAQNCGLFLGDVKLEEGNNDNTVWTTSEADKRGADGANGADAQSQFVSTVFLRQASTPSTPQGGSYDKPLPDGDLWSDGIPAGTEKLWYSHRRFTSDGKSPQDEAWTTPAVLADSANFDVVYCNNTTYNAIPQGHPNTNAEWTEDATENAIWMATCNKTLGGEWSAWKVSRIAGEKGDKGEQGEQGEQGEDATFVYMTVNKTALKQSASEQTVTAMIWERVGSGTPKDITSQIAEALSPKYAVYWRLTNSDGTAVGSMQQGTTATVPANSTNSVIFTLYYYESETSRKILQRITVPMSCDGEDGDNGISYNLRLSSAEVLYDPIDNKILDTQSEITVSLTRVDGTKIEFINTPEQAEKYGLSLYVINEKGNLSDEMLSNRRMSITTIKVDNANDADCGVTPTNGIAVKAYGSFSVSLRLNDEEIDRQFVNLVADASSINEGLGAVGIDLLNLGIVLNGEFVRVKGLNGTEIAEFKLVDGKGRLNVGLINTDELITSLLKAKRQLSGQAVDSSTSMYTSAVNRLGDGAFETFHPMMRPVKIPTGIGSTLTYEDNPALRMVVEDITINDTTYTALLQAFDSSGNLIGALTTQGWITPTDDSITYTPIEFATNEGSLISDEEAMLCKNYSSITYYYIKAKGKNSDYNGKISTEKNTSKIIKADTGSTLVRYDPKYNVTYRLTDNGNAFADSTQDGAVYSRTRYTIYPDGTVVKDSINF